MCNTYSMLSNPDAIRNFVDALSGEFLNMPAFYGIFPDYTAPIVRNFRGKRELTYVRWGLPSLKWVDNGKPDKGNTNIRHPWFDDWNGYLGPQNRCLVPVTTFAEPTKLDDGKSGNAWFSLDDRDPLFFFAGFWTPWRGMRRKDEGVKDHDTFAFLTTKPNDVVGAIHEKAMPVILTTRDEVEAWLTEPWPEAKKLQRSLSDGHLIVKSRQPLGHDSDGRAFPKGDPLRA